MLLYINSPKKESAYPFPRNCKDCNVWKGYVDCRCQKAPVGYVSASIDLNKCPVNKNKTYNIRNNNGTLTCVK